MTVADRIVAHLSSTRQGVCDDCLTKALGLSIRQHANGECRRLAAAGLIRRLHRGICPRCGNAKRVNSALGA